MYRKRNTLDPMHMQVDDSSSELSGGRTAVQSLGHRIMTDSAVPRLAHIRHVAFDMDGTIYLGDRLFDSTPRILATLRSLGVTYSFLTNNSSHSTDEYVAKLKQMGLEVTADQLYTSTHATAKYVQAHYPDVKRLYVLGTESMQAEMRSFRFDVSDDREPDMVIVGFDRTMQYERLCKATWWIARGKPYIASHPDRVCPTDLPTVLVDCGSICAAIEHAVGRRPDAVIGKPEPRMLEGLCRSMKLETKEIAMVGDRLTTDMALARRSDALGVLTLTGEATREEAADHENEPDVIVDDLDELGRLFLGAHR